MSENDEVVRVCSERGHLTALNFNNEVMYYMDGVEERYRELVDEGRRLDRRARRVRRRVRLFLLLVRLVRLERAALAISDAWEREYRRGG